MLYAVGIGSLGCVSVVGYMILLVCWHRNPKIRRHYKYLIGLAISDLSVQPHCIMAVITCFFEEWPFGHFGCIYSAWVAGAFTYISLNTVPLVAKGRYYATTNKVYQDNEEIKDLVVVWLIGIVMAICPFFGFGKYGCESVNDKLKVTCYLDFRDNDWKCGVYVVVLFFLCFLKPILKIIKCYSQAADIDPNCGKMQFMVPLHLLCAFTPYALLAFTSTIFANPDLPWFTVPLCNICAKLFVAINPYMYALNDPLLQRPFRKYLGLREKEKGQRCTKKNRRGTNSETITLQCVGPSSESKDNSKLDDIPFDTYCRGTTTRGSSIRSERITVELVQTTSN